MSIRTILAIISVLAALLPLVIHVAVNTSAIRSLEASEADAEEISQSQPAPTQDVGAIGHNKQCAGCDLTEVNWRGLDMSRANLRGAQLLRANLQGTKLVNAVLTGANLNQSNLSEAHLYGADLKQLACKKPI